MLAQELSVREAIARRSASVVCTLPTTRGHFQHLLDLWSAPPT